MQLHRPECIPLRDRFELPADLVTGDELLDDLHRALLCPLEMLHCDCPVISWIVWGNGKERG